MKHALQIAVFAFAILWSAASSIAQYTLSTLANFNGTNGAGPDGTLIEDSSGNLYGTTSLGGNLSLNNGHGVGTVFEIANDANHTLTTLATFNGMNGATPERGLVADGNGNLYGTTEGGGNLALNSGFGDGTVFEIANDANHTLTTLATFNGTNGAQPFGHLAIDANGNLYGTTNGGGANSNGTVFEVANDANHTLTTLTSFNGSNGGSPPIEGLVIDHIGNLYGLTSRGGNLTLNNGLGDGTLFKVANDANHTFSTLVTFNGTNGANPFGPLTSDANGNLYGVASRGGANNDGTIFEMANDANHTFSTLVTFTNAGPLGGAPANILLADPTGNLYGLGGTSINGSVIEFANDANHTLSTLATFNGQNGAGPTGLIMDGNGQLYGATIGGGTNNDGIVFELSPVPEPSTFVLGALAFGFLAIRRRANRQA